MINLLNQEIGRKVEMAERKVGRILIQEIIANMAIAVFAVFLCGLTACGKKQMEPNVPLQDLIVEYPLDNLLAFAAEEDGTVYAVNLDVSAQEPEYKLYRFDGQGEREECTSLKSYSMIEALALSADGNGVYFTAQTDEYGSDLCLFEYETENGTITMLCRFPYFDNIKQLVRVGDIFYVLGCSPHWQAEGTPTLGYSFSGERLVSYSPVTGEQTQLGFGFPVSMAASGTGTLIVCGYMEGDGYCMMEYDPKKDSMQVISRMSEYKFDKFAVSGGGKDVIYDYHTNSRGLVLSDIHQLSVEAELFPDGITLKVGPVCVGGRVYCDSIRSGTLVSFPLDAVQRQNREITFITREYGALEAPYGCGYLMTRVELSDEKFTLKVLARDKDYDLCMGDTLADNGSNLRENGVFYPLNDVPGIQEYLERCFPYVREAATKEDGTIWMLPVKVNVFGLVAKREALEESGITLRKDMTWEDYKEMVYGMANGQRELLLISDVFFKKMFSNQYFTHYHTVENELFANSVAALSEIWKIECGGKATVENFIFERVSEPKWIESTYMKEQYYGEDAVFVGMPKLEVSDRNLASCIFLAVNPDSARRDEVIAYMGDLIAYQMRREDVPYFADWQGVDALDAAVHEVYENGEIAFAPDPDIYEDGLEELLSGMLPLEEYIRRTEQKLRTYWGE